MRAMLVSTSDAVDVERRCSHGVQLRMDVLGAAEHTAEAWEAAVSAYQREPAVCGTVA